MTQLQKPQDVSVDKLLNVKEFNEDEFKKQLTALGLVKPEDVEKTMKILRNPFGRKLQQLEEMEGWQNAKIFWATVTGTGGLGICTAGAILSFELIKHLVTSPALLIAGKYTIVVLQFICLVGQWYTINQMKDELAQLNNEYEDWMTQVDSIKLRLLRALEVARSHSDVSKVKSEELKKLLNELSDIRLKLLSKLKSKQKSLKNKNLWRKACTIGCGVLGLAGIGLGIACFFLPFGQILGAGILIGVCSVMAIGGGIGHLYHKKTYEEKFKEITLKYEELLTKIMRMESLLETFCDFLELYNGKKHDLKTFFDRTDLSEVADDKYDAWINELVNKKILVNGKRLLAMKEDYFYARLKSSHVLRQPDKEDIWEIIKKIQEKYKNVHDLMINTANLEKN